MKNILLLTTGGTIACMKTDEGLIPSLSGQWLLSKIPEIKSECNIEVKQILNIDSSNISTSDWKMIASAIYDGLKEFDGVVVTHGTDTMAYTTAMMSFMIQNIDKPVVFTGSQIPINEEGSDGVKNLLYSFKTAMSDIKGVCIVFNGKIIRGTRAFKIHSLDKDAFVSCNNAYLGKIIDGQVVMNNIDYKVEGKLKLFKNICDNVFLLKLIPGIKSEIVDFIVENDYKGVVVEAFGLGGIPSAYNDLLKKLKDIANINKIPIIVVSQCVYDGTNLNVYKVGVDAEKCGLISGRDMSVEAAVTKLMWTLGQTNDYEETKTIINKNISGEISNS